LENHPYEVLDDGELLSAACTVATGDVPASSSSDSGVSTDQQLSPMLLEADDDDRGDLLSSLSSGSEGSPLEASHTYSDYETSIQEDVEIDSSVFNILDTSCLGEVKVEDNQAIINMSMCNIVFKGLTLSYY
jgi:hypothetical protein